MFVTCKQFLLKPNKTDWKSEPIIKSFVYLVYDERLSLFNDVMNKHMLLYWKSGNVIENVHSSSFFTFFLSISWCFFWFKLLIILKERWNFKSILQLCEVEACVHNFTHIIYERIQKQASIQRVCTVYTNEVNGRRSIGLPHFFWWILSRTVSLRCISHCAAIRSGTLNADAFDFHPSLKLHSNISQAQVIYQKERRFEL